MSEHIPPESLLRIAEYTDDGYRPLVDFNGWRVAVLNYHDELLPHNLQDLQRHDETDEVFVLVSGRCLLYTGEGEAEIGRIYGTDLQPGIVYTVTRGTWHSHTLSRDARVIIVENTDTGEHNSPRCPLTPQNRNELLQIAAEHNMR